MSAVSDVSQKLPINNVSLNSIESSNTTQWIESFKESMPALPVDHYSNFNAHQISVSSMDLSVNHLDFENKVMSAAVTYEFTKTVHKAKELIFDTTDLHIDRVVVNGVSEDFRVEKTPDYKPDALHINLGAIQEGEVKITYQTSPDASGLFWVDAKHTDGKKHPIFFTQAEPTDGPSWLPGPQSPQVRVKYTLSVNSGDPERMVVASAQNNFDKPLSEGKYSGLKMDIPIPLYLLGIAVGQFAYHPYDSRCGVYAEACKIDEVAFSVKMLPDYIKKAEEICGEYKWGPYRPIYLPLCYPYGAMEHACASFMGGDCVERPSVLPHELSHSWFGNFITNASWGQLFLNEGLTTYIESKITASCIGEDYAMMILKVRLDFCLKKIQQLIEQGKKEAAQLVSPFNSEPPLITAIPYSKGSLFFMMLEGVIGEESLMRFLKDYMKFFGQQSMGAERFLAFLGTWLEEEGFCSDFEIFMKDNQIEEWFYGAEIPSNAPKIESRLLDEINEQAERFLSNKDVSKAVANWEDVQIQVNFINAIMDKATIEQLETLDQSLHFTETKSDYLRGFWALCCSQAGYLTEKTIPMIIEYVIARNSIKWATQISETLLKSEDGKKVVNQILEKGKDRLFPITRKAIEELLK